MTGKKRLAKSTAIVGSGIMTSRVLGFVRDILMAKFFGIGISAQAFVVAFTLPNSLRQLVGEGAVNTALIPVLTDYKTNKTRAEFWHFTNVLFNIFLITLLLITAIGVLAAPLLVRLIAPGFAEDPEKLNLTITIFRIMFPYVLLAGLTAYCTGVLHTFKHFTAPAFASALFNLALIGGILAFCPHVNITYVAWAVLIGGILQLALQIPALSRRGKFFDLKAGLISEGAKRVGRLLLPRIVGAGIYQINIIVDRMLASLQFIVGHGAVAALYYGNRLFQLPLALFGVAVATAALPTMSLQAAENNIEKLKETLSFSLKNMLFFSMPASIGLIVLSRPVVKVLFERDEFTGYATDITSAVLLFYAIGLVAYGGVKILVAAFHSMQNTATPVKIASFTIVINIILNLALMVPLKAGGLALATSISGFINLAALFVMLRRKIGPFGERDILKFFFKVFTASIVMGAAALFMAARMSWAGTARNVFNLLAVIFTCMAVYAISVLALRVHGTGKLLSWIKKS